jgi:hypothetical protein
MRAAQLKERPSFSLMKQTDIQSIYYMQMPRWLFSDPRYAVMSLDAKVTYTFLLNRFQLSRRKGWVNDYGEVFVIFPRKALAAELRICEKRVIAAFHKLAELHLIWEKRCGRGDANQIYLAKIEPADDPDYECTPFTSEEYEYDSSRTADPAVLEEEGELPAAQEPQDRQFKNCKKGSSRTAGFAAPELPDRPPSRIEIRNTEQSQKEVSQSVRAAPDADRPTDDEKELIGILDACELYLFPEETARVFENAIERLFYSDSYRIGNATLPRSRVRAKLRFLNAIILQEAERKLAANQEREVKNSTAYTMATVFNCIAESESDLMVDPYLNSLRVPNPPGRC